MNKVFLTVVIILLELIILVAGVGLGVIFGGNLMPQQIDESGNINCNSLVADLSSPAITLINASGEIESISDNTITIMSNGSSLKIATNINTLVYIPGANPSAGGAGSVLNDKYKISDLSVGRLVNVNLKVSMDGSLMATLISAQ